MNKDDLDEKVEAFEERMKAKKTKEQAEALEKADKLRGEYLQRTGRTEMEP